MVGEAYKKFDSGIFLAIRLRFRQVLEPLGTVHSLEFEPCHPKSRKNVLPAGTKVWIDDVVNGGRFQRGENHFSNCLSGIIDWQPGRVL
jgi:hypothetical protein